MNSHYGASEASKRPTEWSSTSGADSPGRVTGSRKRVKPPARQRNQRPSQPKQQRDQAPPSPVLPEQYSEGAPVEPMDAGVYGGSERDVVHDEQAAVKGPQEPSGTDV